MNIRKILTFVVLLAFIAALSFGIYKNEVEETKFNGNLL